MKPKQEIVNMGFAKAFVKRRIDVNGCCTLTVKPLSPKSRLKNVWKKSFKTK